MKNSKVYSTDSDEISKDELSTNGFSKPANNINVIKETTLNLENETNNVKERKLYKADSTPPAMLTFFFGLQVKFESILFFVKNKFLLFVVL